MSYFTASKLKSKSKKAPFDPLSLSLTLAIILVMVLILVNPVRYSASVTSGLKLFFTAVLPGLLPFLFFTKLLTRLGFIAKVTQPLDRFSRAAFGVNHHGLYAFLLSIISGYPIGSTIVADMAKRQDIESSDITRAALLSSTSGPIFVIGAVGGAMLNKPLWGLIIYASNVLAVLISSFILARFSKSRASAPASLQPEPQSRTKLNLSELSKETCIGLLVVGFYIAFFSLVIDLLGDIGLSGLKAQSSITSTYLLGIMSGIVEMTNGAKALSSVHTPLSLALIGFVIGFSGISIIMQSLSFLAETDIKKGRFVLGKLLQATLTFLLCFLIFSLIL